MSGRGSAPVEACVHSSCEAVPGSHGEIHLARGSTDRRHLAARRAMRLIALGALLVCAAITSSAASASAATYDIRGEWEAKLTCTCNSQTTTASLLITKMESSGEFSGTVSLDSLFPGTITGTLTQSDDDLVLLIAATTPLGPSTFTMTSGAVNTATNEMSGTGYFEGGGTTGKPSGALTGKRLRTYAEVQKAEEEKRLKAEEEARKRALEAKEREAKEKELKVKETQEREAKEKEKAQQEKEALEAKERAEKASKESVGQGGGQTSGGQGGTTQNGNTSTPPPPLTPVTLTTRSPSLSGAGTLSLGLSNANGSPISGQLTLIGSSAAKAGKGSRGGAKAAVLGEASFAIPAHGKALVKLRLSKSARAALARRGKLRVTVKIVTSASGQAPIVKSYSLTLQLAGHAHH
jgi:hypothetical protein